jgi:hypothetical protein
MPTVYLTEEACRVLDTARAYIGHAYGLEINQSQAIEYLAKAWEDLDTKPAVYYTDVNNPGGSAIFHKPSGAVEMSKDDRKKPIVIRASLEKGSEPLPSRLGYD